ncbi:MAG: hypothetical protein WCS90_06220 [Bacilli bacterium]
MEKKALKIIETAYYFLASFACFLFLNLFTSEISANFQNLRKSLPFLLFLALAVFLLFIIHLYAHPVNEDKRRKTATANGAILVALSFLVILLITIDKLDGTYSSLLEGGFTPLFPLDAYVGSFLLLIAGSLLYYSGERLKKHPRPIVYNSHEWKGRGSKVLTSISRSFFAVIALYFMGALLVSPFFMSFTSEHAFGLVAFDLLMGLPSAMLALYNWNYLDKEPLPQRQRLYKNSVITTLLALILALTYWLVQAFDPLFLIDGAASLLPLDFLLSVKLAPYLLILITLGASLTAFLHYLDRNVPKKSRNP